METGQAPKCTSSAQSLQAFVNELKSVQSPSVLDNGAVLLLPKNHCCCAGSCHGVAPRDNKEIQETQENRHDLEGVWERISGTVPSIYLMHTARSKPGYLFATLMNMERAKELIFWFRTGDGRFKDVLEGKWLNLDGEFLIFLFFFFVFFFWSKLGLLC